MKKKSIDEQLIDIDKKKTELRTKKQLLDILNSSPFKDRVQKLNEEIDKSRRALELLSKDTAKGDQILSKAFEEGAESVFETVEKNTKIDSIDISDPAEARKAFRMLLKAKREPASTPLPDICSSFLSVEEREMCKISMGLAKKRVNGALMKYNFREFKE